MSRTRARLERIEAALRPAAVMCLFISIDCRKPIGWSHGAREWRQHPDETDEEFKNRMISEAQASMPQTGGGRACFLWFSPIFATTDDEGQPAPSDEGQKTC